MKYESVAEALQSLRDIIRQEFSDEVAAVLNGRLNGRPARAASVAKPAKRRRSAASLRKQAKAMRLSWKRRKAAKK